MTTWNEFAEAEPEFAARVRERFTSYRHHTMATVRKDGSPRISGTEVEFSDDGMAIGVMPDAVRLKDLSRGGRIAIHSHPVDPNDDNPSEWPGEAKVTGVAVEVSPEALPVEGHRFLIEPTEVVLTHLNDEANRLVIESWRGERGLTRIERS